ncbi:MAG: sulfite exporter TauE/SafE family protein [Allosphingosinicella sp.]
MDIAFPGLLELLPFIAVGFAAQLIDGALGMAFKVISSTLLLSLGMPPAAASATVHAVGSFTSAVAGVSHVLHGNVDWRLFGRLVAGGIVGGILGAYVLTEIPAETARPFVFAYLSLIALYLFWRAFRFEQKERRPRYVAPLGTAGGFLDAAGGGGWGPVVTSNLLVQGAEPRKVIGTVNTAEFFVTVTVSATFLATLGLQAFTTAFLGLLIGGVAAAPVGGYAAKKIPARPLLFTVAAVLLLTSGYGVYRALA